MSPSDPCPRCHGQHEAGPCPPFGGGAKTDVGMAAEPPLDLTADVLLHPSFPDEELARYKQRTRAQLTQQRANPGFLANEMFAKAIYGDHPGSRTAPSLPAVDGLTRDAIVEFHRTHYVPDYALFAIVGDISMADARKTVDAHFAGWN